MRWGENTPRTPAVANENANDLRIVAATKLRVRLVSLAMHPLVNSNHPENNLYQSGPRNQPLEARAKDRGKGPGEPSGLA